ncbi:hypothetical protein BOFE_10050 (plasmid) [Candidatus Borrelia fainii]|uniref:Uncharacterized protein n=1 Tax=Candidatus Borrelia fainii TaxID=2518322 RepID=A0ABN6USV4_9SPIR|nr:hypothetical protein [Candidatus Borrelia fainii]BDU63465.1 hypothetical protein BOFE_10050 [Candidatus Borrelia fainii]
MTRSMLRLEFISSFSRYLELGLKPHNYKIEELESQISNFYKKILNNKIAHSEEESKKLED